MRHSAKNTKFASETEVDFPPPARPVNPKGGHLTPREREVLALVALGYSAREAGERLGVTKRTIEVHRERAIKKIGDSAPVVLVDAARRLGLIPKRAAN